MGHISEERTYAPPSREEVFLCHLDKSIRFHRENQNDPHNIGNAVMCALLETRNAYAKAFKLPAQDKCRPL